MPPILLPLLILGLIGAAVRSLAAELAGMTARGDGAARGDMPDDPGELPAWLHRVVTETYAAETQEWALELVRRVDERLQAARPPGERLTTVILWIPEVSAFTLPGRHVYLSRRLLERAPDDDTVAMVVAHEIAHHDLGHVADMERWLARLATLGGALAAPLTIASQKRLHGAEREAEADAHGFNLCLAAGYDAHRCLYAFDVLEAANLDAGNVEGVFGPDDAIDAELAGAPRWLVELKRWTWERRRGYPPLRERKERLRAAYEEEAARARARGDAVV